MGKTLSGGREQRGILSDASGLSKGGGGWTGAGFAAAVVAAAAIGVEACSEGVRTLGVDITVLGGAAVRSRTLASSDAVDGGRGGGNGNGHEERNDDMDGWAG
jgi:hypothetical protein